MIAICLPVASTQGLTKPHGSRAGSTALAIEWLKMVLMCNNYRQFAKFAYPHVVRSMDLPWCAGDVPQWYVICF